MSGQEQTAGAHDMAAEELAAAEAAELPATPTDLTSSVGSGGLWSLGGQAVVLVASLVATPFVVRLLPPELYGLLALIQSVIAYITFAGLGTSLSSTKFGADAYARKDDEGEVAVVWTSLAIALVPAVIGGAALALAAPAVMTFLSVPSRLQAEGALALRIATIGFVARSAYGCLNTPQAVRLRWDTITKIESGTSILQVGLVPVILALGGGLVAAVTVATSVEGLRLLLHLVFSWRLQPGLLRIRVRRALMRPLVRFGGALALSSLVMIPLRNVERLFLARFDSVSSVAHYSLAATVALLLGVFPMAMAQPMLPGFTRLYASGDIESVTKLFLGLLRAILLCTVPVAVLLCAVARPAFTIWAGAEYGRQSTGPFYILVIGLAVSALTYPCTNILLALDRANVWARVHLGQLVPYVLVAALLTSAYGAIGAAVAWSSRLIVECAIFAVASHRIGGVPFSPLPANRRSYLLAVGVLVPPLLVGTLTDNVVLIAVAALVAGALHVAVLVKRVLTPEEIEFFAQLAARVRPRAQARTREAAAPA